MYNKPPIHKASTGILNLFNSCFSVLEDPCQDEPEARLQCITCDATSYDECWNGGIMDVCADDQVSLDSKPCTLGKNHEKSLGFGVNTSS